MATCLISVNPDLSTPAGHYLYLDRELAREAERRGWSFQAWGHCGLSEELLDENGWLRRAFRDLSATRLNHDAAHRQRFLEDLTRQTEAVLAARPADDVVLFIYAGHVCQLGAFWRLLERIAEPRLRVVFNLYAAHWEFDRASERFQFMSDTMRRLLGPGRRLADGERFTLTSDSALVAAEAEASWAHRVPVMPFFSLLRPEEAAAPAGDEVTISYPSSFHRQRGVAVFRELVQRCSAQQKLRFVFRTCVSEAQLAPEEALVCRELEAAGARIVHGALSERAMRDFYADASIILNPYPARYFRARTSANVADALAFGKPVIAVRGTWAGDLVERLGCGEVFEDGDGESLAGAVMKVAAELPAYKERSRRAGEEWVRENNVAAVVDFVQRVSVAPAEPLSAQQGVEWKDLLFALLDSPANFSQFAPAAAQDGTALPEPEVRRRRALHARVARLEQRAEAMQRALEHYRASPVRALRLWLRRKQRRLSL